MSTATPPTEYQRGRLEEVRERRAELRKRVLMIGAAVGDALKAYLNALGEMERTLSKVLNYVYSDVPTPNETLKVYLEEVMHSSDLSATINNVLAAFSVHATEHKLTFPNQTNPYNR